jgi:hypothetical protein
MTTGNKQLHFDHFQEQMDWSRIKHLNPEKFDDPSYPGSHTLMDPLTIISLEDLREQTGWKIITHNKFGLRSCVCVNPVATAHHRCTMHHNAAWWIFILPPKQIPALRP